MVMKEHAEQSYHSNGMKWFNKNLDIKNRQQPHDDIDINPSMNLVNSI